jgi:hypothetical protein
LRKKFSPDARRQAARGAWLSRHGLQGVSVSMKAMPIVIACIAASIVWGQTTVNRVFEFTHITRENELQEAATVVRAITESPIVSFDVGKRTLELRGTTSQMAAADWLIHELDREGAGTNPAEYRVPGESDDIVRVFYMKHTQTVQDLQEAATLIRSMTGVRRLFTYNAPRAIATRGTAAQINLAEWLVRNVDHAERQADSGDYRVSADGSDVVRVFHLANTKTPRDLQEVATLVRAIGDIRRVFTYNAPRVITLRGSSQQMALSAWLIREVDSPASQEGAREYSFAEGGDENTVRVFHLKHTETPQQLQQLATYVRSTSKVRRLFTYNAPKAMALRGTAEQVAVAAQLVKERGE